ncbi:ABC transporter permease [Hymenobacter sp. ASUV-10]|uniref:ABC transporter permease n=1 Tax=Hymenobacter aranciens TaxID=3063996 RepID=A0ABT9B7L8_9BACT|nr:ABC transporter permease [Hymenobacter sp. ASUV-10]MDO7874188.1 ABC transporter permease [Hymenobacter sp. ASUV-10]
MASKFFLVAQREYLTRVRKKAFIVLTLAVPLLIAAFGFFMVKIVQSDDDNTDVVEVRDESGLGLAARLVSTPQLQFVPSNVPLAQGKKAFQKAEHAGLLYLPAGLNPDEPTGVQFFGKGNISLRKQVSVESALNKAFSELKMQKSGLTEEQLNRLKAKVDLQAVSLDETGKEEDSNALVTSGLSYGLALLIYLFIFIYGVQIMRGIGEEKSSRIMEVMLSSVKPFDLMMGKIIGIAAVGLTQFLLWGILSTGATSVISSLATDTNNPKTEMAATASRSTDAAEQNAGERFDKQIDKVGEQAPGGAISKAFASLGKLPIGIILFGFIVYFLGGYLLYGALFGAIGAAVDDQTDTQQFMFPVTAPLVLSYIVSITVILRNPDGPLAFWMSIIPFTSPIAMVVRLPFGVPLWQLGLSIALLIAGFIGTVWLAARIYRVGILMYGKKVTYREMSKWMFYKG